MGWGGAWAHLPPPSFRLQALARAWKVEEATFSTVDWLGGSCMLGSASQAHMGCMLTGVSRLGQTVGSSGQPLV